MTFNDAIHTRVTINFSFSDKVRVLFGRKVTVSVDVRTENVVGSTESESTVTVGKFLKTRGAAGGQYAVTDAGDTQ